MTIRAYSVVFTVAIVGMATVSAAKASGDEAWVQFEKDVAVKCLKAAGAGLSKPTIVVDPYGSGSFGLAIVSGNSGKSKVSYMCVYDKKSSATEIGTELHITVVKRPAQ